MKRPEEEIGSVSYWLGPMKDGDSGATNELARRYFERLVAAAGTRLRARGVRAVDGDDVAASVFESLWKRAAQGAFTDCELDDREDLWRLLYKMMQSKIVDAVRREQAAKRGGGKVRGESVFEMPGQEGDYGLGNEPGEGPLPIEVAMLAERHAQLMAALNNDVLREIVMLRLEGHQLAEIAEKVDLSTRSVKRKLAIARGLWSQVVEMDP